MKTFFRSLIFISILAPVLAHATIYHPVTTLSATSATGIDITLDSSFYNYTLYVGNPSLWGNLQPGGYVEYTVNASVAGTYSLQAYYATVEQGAQESLVVNGMTQSVLNLPSTGSWGNMVLSAPANITLPLGESVIQIISSGTFEAYNLAGLLASPVATAAAPVAAPVVAAGTTVSSTGVTGFDITSASNSNGYTLYVGSPSLWGNLQSNGFVEYTVSAAAGTYALQLYYSSGMTAGATILVNGVAQGAASLPNTGSWNSYTMSPAATLALPSGTSTLRIAAQIPFSAFNLEGMTLAPAAAPVVTTSTGGASSGSGTFGSPLAGTNFFVNPYSESGQNIGDSCTSYYPGSSGLIAKLAAEPQGVWFGDWNSNIQSDVAGVVSAAAATKTTPIMVAYNIPLRDCSGYSSGGATSAAAYQTWIQGMAAGIGSSKAVIVLEPDALTQLYNSGCLTPDQQTERLSLLNYAVSTFKQSTPNALVYMDAGDAGAFAPSDIASRLQAAGVANAAGFALNTSNYIATDITTNYGNQISSLAGGKHFVIDTSRNGLGATVDNQWCNPPNRGAGAPAQGFASGTTDAYLWVQNPGTSDGTCNGGPSAGTFSPQLACTLAYNAIF